MTSPFCAWQPELTFAQDFADRAGARVRALVASGLDVATKADASPVTTADQQLNDAFIDEVSRRFPGDGVLGEEASLPGRTRDGVLDGVPEDGERVWVIDPIDGTQQLILGIPLFMISIALVVDGRPVVAVAHNPSTGDMYWASIGQGAFRGTPHGRSERLVVSSRSLGPDTTGAVTVNAGGSVPFEAGLNSDGLVQLQPGPVAAPHRFPWPSVFSGCKVAEGAWEADLYSGTAPWDVAAVALLVSEAGGTVTDRLGRPQRYSAPVNGCILSNGHVHEALVTAWSREYVPRA